MKILGFDPSLTSPGYAVIEIERNKPRLIDCGHVKTKSSQTMPQRLKIIHDFLQGVYLKHHDVDFVVRESVLQNRINSRTNEVMAYVTGLIILTCQDHEVYKITPNKSKQFTTGTKKYIKKNEKSEKKRVELAVRKWLNLPESFTFRSHDESDACCIALGFALQENILKME